MSSGYEHTNKTVQVKKMHCSTQKIISINTIVGVVVWHKFLSNKDCKLLKLVSS